MAEFTSNSELHEEITQTDDTSELGCVGSTQTGEGIAQTHQHPKTSENESTADNVRSSKDSNTVSKQKELNETVPITKSGVEEVSRAPAEVTEMTGMQHQSALEKMCDQVASLQFQLHQKTKDCMRYKAETLAANESVRRGSVDLAHQTGLLQSCVDALQAKSMEIIASKDAFEGVAKQMIQDNLREIQSLCQQYQVQNLPNPKLTPPQETPVRGQGTSQRTVQQMSPFGSQCSGNAIITIGSETHVQPTDQTYQNKALSDRDKSGHGQTIQIAADFDGVEPLLLPDGVITLNRLPKFMAFDVEGQKVCDIDLEKFGSEFPENAAGSSVQPNSTESVPSVQPSAETNAQDTYGNDNVDVDSVDDESIETDNRGKLHETCW